MWIWQQQNWPDFSWDQQALASILREVTYNQGLLMGQMGLQNVKLKQQALDTLLANIIHSSAIEGEKLMHFLYARHLLKNSTLMSSLIQRQCKVITLLK